MLDSAKYKGRLQNQVRVMEWQDGLFSQEEEVAILMGWLKGFYCGS